MNRQQIIAQLLEDELALQFDEISFDDATEEELFNPGEEFLFAFKDTASTGRYYMYVSNKNSVKIYARPSSRDMRIDEWKSLDEPVYLFAMRWINSWGDA